MKTDMRHSITLSSLAVAVAFFWCLPSDSSLAQDIDGTPGQSLVVLGEPSNRIDLEIGYFTCRRQMFREIYGGYLDYGLNFQHRINNRLSWGLRTEFIRLHEKGSSVKYWTLSETPMIIYALSDQAAITPVVGGGIGLTLRNIVGSMVRYSGGVTVTQRELSAAVVAMAGIDLRLSKSLILGGRAYFDYHPLGDPSTGAFGDTGGYHFTFRLGRKF